LAEAAFTVRQLQQQIDMCVRDHVRDHTRCRADTGRVENPDQDVARTLLTNDTTSNRGALMRPTLTVLAFAVAAFTLALPAAAAVPTYNGTVGPGFTITMAKKPTKVGQIKLVVADKSNIHNFHLTGPGVNVKTSVGSTGTKTFSITLKKGTYKFVCDPHASTMKGSFKVS
jgi:plastocyanin